MTKSSSLFPWKSPEESALPQALFDRVADAAFPCVGAKAAMARGSLEVLVARDLRSAWDDVRIHDRLIHFAEESRQDEGLFNSLAVMFEGPDTLSENEFEHHLWNRVQSLSDKDLWRGQAYDGAVSSDPADPHFSLSFGGEAFFVVGLHPRANRPARRFPYPVMVFNPHAQFETLRAQGKYEGIREKIMVRDEALAGSRNPMLARHGTTSEARQYSGRHVNSDWKCPFQYKGAQ
ncbi:YqcI/YcgG family protein [Sphingomonas sp. QA11]|uniref:guanitoxin biosynthesis heme-dependent pre-guanitoxin N-hydroxylase GntA n=1 Tax=Sphingomonas sp. QA11 TaxID=2950605 RepID=UPI00234B4C92|nr:guanitoxin biosynthesis heme-dependent pre-guanitoxin N-hydroxylase GntA [Sphingomonas sp. QA11]WCM25877.1 YqcI/YcgG family protein [Sphingomonas sp. QA11]